MPSAMLTALAPGRRGRCFVTCVCGTALTMAVAAGCSDTTGPLACDPEAPGPSISGARRDSLPPLPDPPLTIDDEWAAIARQVPGGWGGFFLENGQPTVYLVDPSERSAALAALYARGVGQPFDIRDATVWKGRWDFAQLYDWDRYIWVAVGWPDGLVTRDIDEYRNRLVYGVRDTLALDSITATFESADLPCELLLIEVTGDIVILP